MNIETSITLAPEQIRLVIKALQRQLIDEKYDLLEAQNTIKNTEDEEEFFQANDDFNHYENQIKRTEETISMFAAHVR